MNYDLFGIYYTTEGIFFARTNDLIRYHDTEEAKNLRSKLHRENGPAIMMSNGSYYWYNNGKLHNKNGPACIYVIDGEIYHNSYYLYGMVLLEDQFHDLKDFSENEIALKLNHFVFYTKDGRDSREDDLWLLPTSILHRIDGPALLLPDGQQFWYIDGNKLTEEEFNIKKLKYEV